MRIAVICGEAAGVRLLQALSRGPYEVAAVLAWGPAQAVATRLGYRPEPAERVREPALAAELAARRVDLLLNVHSLHIVPAALLEVPRLGAWNLHPGPLPRYAGLNAPSWAIYHGERSHGVTVHRMERGIDTGDIAYQDCFPIEETDTGLSLSLRCAERGVGLVQRLLEDAPAVPRRPQDASLRSYFGRAAPQGGRIDWHSPARRIYDFVRACDYGPFPSPWGVPRARLGDDEVEIRKLALTGERCTAAPGTVRGDRVATSDEWLLLHQRAEPKRSGRLSERLGY